MTWISVDVETDGPIPGDFSMIHLGAVVIDKDLTTTFEAKIAPITHRYDPEALAISGFTREETETFQHPLMAMMGFSEWLNEVAEGTKLKFWADNNGFDWSFVNWYLWHFTGRNPFGYSCERINNLYHGAERSMSSSFKHLRETVHTHNPVDDAIGNAEAVKAIIVKYEIEIPEIEYRRMFV